MASRYEVELTVSSAKDLKNVNWRHGPIKPYVVVWVDSDRKVSSRVDEEGDTCPQWNQKVVVPVDRAIEEATLYIDIVHAYPSEDTEPLIGSTKLSLREVVDDAGIGRRSLKLKRPSGRLHGKLEVEVVVRQPRYQASDPYGAPPYEVSRDMRHGSGSYMAPPPLGSGPYTAPPPFGYPAYAAPSFGGYPSYGQPSYAEPAYAHPAYGQPNYGQPAYEQQKPSYGQAEGYDYGQRGPVVEEEKKSKFGGMGVGTGLAIGAVAGALGGLALAEGFEKFEEHVADKAAERVEDDFEGDYYNDGGDDW